MRIALLTAWVLAAGTSGAGPENLTTAGPDRAPLVKIQVTPSVGNEDAAGRLIDGNAKTSHFTATQIEWPGGATPTVTIDLLAPRLITSIEVGYAGEIRPAGIDRRQRGTWSTLPAGLLQDNPAKYPKTSWLLGKDLSIPADSLRMRWHVGSGGGQLTEICVRGERDAGTACVGNLATMPRLPVARKTAEVMVDLRNPDRDAKRSIAVRCRLRDDQGREVCRTERVSREVPPLRSTTVRASMAMPGPGRYALTASVEGSPSAEISSTVYVLSRELQFIWYGVPEAAQWATMLTTVSQPNEIERWRRRGVVALGWSGGISYRNNYDAKGFAEYWTRRLESHPVGIAVDEFGNVYGKPSDLKMASGLLRAHRAVPDKMIVIWQAGMPPPEVADAYRIAADWIIPECYMNYFGDRFSHFDARIRRLREFGLIHKSVMGLCCTSDKIGTTAEGLARQVRYVRRKAPEMPGLGFYKAYGTGAALVSVADRLCYEYFIKPTILAEPCGRAHGRILVRNIGAQPASDVEVVFEKYQRRSLQTAQTDRIARLEPDAIAEVRLDANRFGNGRYVFRVKRSQAYSCVSTPLTIEVSGK